MYIGAYLLLCCFQNRYLGFRSKYLIIDLLMASVARSSPYRDRTSEFRSLSERLKKMEGIASPDQETTATTTTTSNDAETSTSTFPQSEFKIKASRIGSKMQETSHKIDRLAQLSKRSSMFDDPLVEIQELTAVIKNDITVMNMSVSELQALQNMEIADDKCSKDRVVHATTICDDLKNRLMGTTKKFQNVLTARTEHLKAHESRKQIFSTNAARENPFLNHAKPVTEPPPWSNVSKASGSSPPSTIPSNNGQNASQLRRRLAVDSSPSPQMEMSMLQQVIPRQETYTQSRASALQNVESTISELGGIFTQLATMVAQQGELAIRIDDNMDESLSNVEGAHGALLKNLSKISSNRWLLIKIFAILIFFLMVFLFFVA